MGLIVCCRGCGDSVHVKRIGGLGMMGPLIAHVNAW